MLKSARVSCIGPWTMLLDPSVRLTTRVTSMLLYYVLGRSWKWLTTVASWLVLVMRPLAALVATCIRWTLSRLVGRVIR